MTIAAGHWIHDTYTAFLAPLLIVFKENLGLSNAEAGLLSVFMQEASLAQPFIGGIADRFGARYFVILAPAVTGVAMSLLGLAPNYLTLAILLTIVGVSSACIHAVGPVLTGNHSGSKLGLGMSLWMVGGESGRFIGPLVIAVAVPVLTLPNIYWLMVGGLLASAILFLNMPADPTHAAKSQQKGVSLRQELRGKRKIIAVLVGLIIIHVFMSAALVTYLPVLLHDQGETFSMASFGLASLQAAGVVGAFFGGTLSDKLGRRWMLFASILPTSIFMFVFLAATGWMRLPLLLILGFTALSITPVTMALVQESFPQNRALANGFYMALSFFVRSIVVIGLGWLGDGFGLRTAFFVSAIVPLLGLPLLVILPNKKTVVQVTQ
ncbi:MAG: MFS transporter [Chloroflexi bacterium]|nr:MFS transporter [Chloroflexota bacterium]